METKKVGAVVVATDQGLGYLAKDFYDNGIIDKVYIHQHTSRENHNDWYPESARVQSVQDLLKCDTLLFFETPFSWKLIPMARESHVRTVLMPMYECTNYPLPYEPDKIICPSMLDMEYYEGKGEFIPVPVDVKWRQRTKAQVFVHNAGNGGLGGRNGTRELLNAMQFVKKPIKLIVRSQVPLQYRVEDSRIEYRIETVAKSELWDEGDVFVFPEKFNGLSLPLQEAFASGMLVIAGNRFPINTWLPKEPLIPVDSYKKEMIAVEFQSAVYTPKAIAAVLDKWYDKDITKFSLLGKEYAEKNSWKKLKEKYETVL